jgi:hypothetical protein
MLPESRAETTEGRLENVLELKLLAGGFHTARELLDHAARHQAFRDTLDDRDLGSRD